MDTRLRGYDILSGRPKNCKDTASGNGANANTVKMEVLNGA
jgi:hypothetical protein